MKAIIFTKVINYTYKTVNFYDRYVQIIITLQLNRFSGPNHNADKINL